MSEPSRGPLRTWTVAVTVLTVGLIAAVAITHARRYFFLFDDYCLVGVAGTTSLVNTFTSALLGFYRPFPFDVLRVEWALFGWHSPGAYALVSMLLHFANALLLARLVLLLRPDDTRVALLSSSIFVLSPWASEAFFWTSGQFDLIGTCCSLLALVWGLQASGSAATGRTIPWKLIGAGLATGLALLSKEAYVTLPPVFGLLAIYPRPANETFSSRRATAVATTMLLVFGTYLVARTQVLATLTGAYGDYGDLIRHAHPWRLVHPLVMPPADLSGGMLARSARIFLALFAMVAAVTALIRAPRRSVMAVAAIAVALLPVLPFGVARNSTAGGRFLYWPGVFAALLYADGLIALSSVQGSGRIRSMFAALTGSVMLGCMAVSLLYQQRIWGAASDLARACVKQVAAARAGSTHLYITNLPDQLAQGPYLLKSYAFSYYFEEPELQVRADRVSLRYHADGVEEVRRDHDPFSQYDQNEGEVVVTLDYERR